MHRRKLELSQSPYRWGEGSKLIEKLGILQFGLGLVPQWWWSKSPLPLPPERGHTSIVWRVGHADQDAYGVSVMLRVTACPLTGAATSVERSSGPSRIASPPVRAV